MSVAHEVNMMTASILSINKTKPHMETLLKTIDALRVTPKDHPSP